MAKQHFEPYVQQLGLLVKQPVHFPSGWDEDDKPSAADLDFLRRHYPLSGLAVIHATREGDSGRYIFSCPPDVQVSKKDVSVLMAALSICQQSGWTPVTRMRATDIARLCDVSPSGQQCERIYEALTRVGHITIIFKSDFHGKPTLLRFINSIKPVKGHVYDVHFNEEYLANIRSADSHPYRVLNTQHHGKLDGLHARVYEVMLDRLQLQTKWKEVDPMYLAEILPLKKIDHYPSRIRRKIEPALKAIQKVTGMRIVLQDAERHGRWDFVRTTDLPETGYLPFTGQLSDNKPEPKQKQKNTKNKPKKNDAVDDKPIEKWDDILAAIPEQYRDDTERLNALRAKCAQSGPDAVLDAVKYTVGQRYDDFWKYLWTSIKNGYKKPTNTMASPRNEGQKNQWVRALALLSSHGEDAYVKYCVANELDHEVLRAWGETLKPKQD